MAQTNLIWLQSHHSL